MIIDCKINQNIIELLTDTGTLKVAEYDVSKVVFNEQSLLCISRSEDTVWLLNETGKCIQEVNNTESLYIMYIQKHPRFGLCVVASVRDENFNWNDMYLAYVDGDFRPISTAR